MGESTFDFANYNRFQKNLTSGRPNYWQCRAGCRYLYVCEEGLVHCCSQQRGRPGIPLENYTEHDLEREAKIEKTCAPLCTISCVHQTAMLDSFRERPRATLAGILERRRRREPGFQPPLTVRLLSWMFLDVRLRSAFRKLALKLLGVVG